MMVWPDSSTVLTGLGLRFHRDVDDRLREHHALEDHLRVGHAERVTGRGVLEAHDGDDVTGKGFRDLLAGVGVHLEQATDTLALFLDGVLQHHALLELA